MDEVKIKWTSTAINQRNKIFEYWNNRNKSNSYSKKLNQKTYKIIDVIKQNPLAGTEIENEIYRIIHFENYSIVYKPELPHIHIVAFWDNRQNPKKLRKILGI